MKNQIDYFERIQKGFKKLKAEYPTSTMGKHLDIAFGEYRCLFSVSDKELSHALDKYIAELDIDTFDCDVEEIVKDGQTMFTEIEVDEDLEDEEYIDQY